MRRSPKASATPVNRPKTSLIHGLDPAPSEHTQIEQSAIPGNDRSQHDARGLSPALQTKAEIDPQMSPHMRVLNFGELKSLKHIDWNEEHIAQLVDAGLFPAQFTKALGASRTSTIG